MEPTIGQKINSMTDEERQLWGACLAEVSAQNRIWQPDNNLPNEEQIEGCLNHVPAQRKSDSPISPFPKKRFDRIEYQRPQYVLENSRKGFSFWDHVDRGLVVKATSVHPDQMQDSGAVLKAVCQAQPKPAADLVFGVKVLVDDDVQHVAMQVFPSRLLATDSGIIRASAVCEGDVNSATTEQEPTMDFDGAYSVSLNHTLRD